jgi:hypothetical protein
MQLSKRKIRLWDLNYSLFYLYIIACIMCSFLFYVIMVVPEEAIKLRL